MKFITFIFCLCCATSVFAAGPVKMSKTLVPEGSTAYPVEITYFAEDYPVGTTTAYQKKGVVKLDEAAAFIERVISDNASADPSRILSLWRGEEKVRLEETMAGDKELIGKNANFFKIIEDTRFIRKFYYGDYILVLVEHYGNFGDKKEFEKVYPLEKRGSEMYLTNKLKDDPFYLSIVDILY